MADKRTEHVTENVTEDGFDIPCSWQKDRVTARETEPFCQLNFAFDAASEKRLDAIENDLDEALADIKGIAKKLRVMQDVY